MPKAILELPKMPENCKECLLHSWESNERTLTLICKILLVNGLPHKRREDCPLKLVEGKEDEWKAHEQNLAKCDADHIAALTADKDEQTEQMKYLLRWALPTLEVANDQQELIDAINALIGGEGG